MGRDEPCAVESGEALVAEQRHAAEAGNLESSGKKESQPVNAVTLSKPDSRNSQQGTALLPFDRVFAKKQNAHAF